MPTSIPRMGGWDGRGGMIDWEGIRGEDRRGRGDKRKGRGDRSEEEKSIV